MGYPFVFQRFRIFFQLTVYQSIVVVIRYASGNVTAQTCHENFVKKKWRPTVLDACNGLIFICISFNHHAYIPDAQSDFLVHDENQAGPGAQWQ